MALGDLYELRDHQLFNLTNPMMNRYHYTQTAGAGAGAVLLANAFVADVLPSIVAIQNVAVIHSQIEVINLDDPGDFFTLSIGIANQGVRAGEVLPSYVGWAFRLNRPSRSIRNGRKNFAGVSEADQSNGLPVAGIVSALNSTAAALGVAIEVSSTGVFFTPTLVKNPDEQPPIRESYEVTQASYVRVSTQNTRKDF